MKIPFSKPSIGKQEEKEVLRIMRSGWLTTGQECLSFEKEFAKRVGVKHALTVNSGTAGLHLGLEAAGVGRGIDVVTMSPLTFAATAGVVSNMYTNINFVDVEKDRPLIDVGKIEALNGEQAIIPVHIAGQECAMSELLELARKNNLSVIEDAAHAFPAKDKDGIFTGTKGDVGMYSFYANKTMTTGEGGMVVTNNDRIATRIKLMRLHGIDRDVWNRYQSDKPSWYYEIKEAGYKYNMPDMLAAVGRVQLKKANQFHAARKYIAKRYIRSLRNFDFLTVPEYISNHSWHLFQIRLNLDKLNIDRNEFIELLASFGVGSSVHFIPLHIMPYYKKTYGLKPEDFPNAMNFYQRTISLPIYPDLTMNQVEYIIDTVKRIGSKFYKKYLAFL